MTTVRRRPRRRTRWTWVRRVALGLVTVLVLEYLVVPQLAGTREAVDRLSGIRPGWVALGVAMEALSLLSYSRLTRRLVPTRPPSFSWLLRTDLTALGVSHAVPGGAATSAALRYRLLRRGGTTAPDAVVVGTVQAVGSAAVLVALFWVALVVSIPLIGIHAGYVTAAALGAVVLGLLVWAVVGLSRGGPQVTATTSWLVDRLPGRFRTRAAAGLSRAVTRVQSLLADPHTLRRSLGGALGNWLFDAASLWVFLAAYGWSADPLALLVAYGLASVVGSLPISPGGLGVVEGVLIPSLVGFGSPSTVALLGVVSWRLFEFWLPIPIAGLTYLSLRR